MTTPFDTGSLHAVLDHATQHIDSPELAGTALAGARRVRARRRVAAAGAAALAVVAAFGISQVVGDPNTAPPVTPPKPTPTEVIAPAIPDDVVQPEWDPATAGSLAEADLADYPNRSMLVDTGAALEVTLTGGGGPVTIDYPEAPIGSGDMPPGDGGGASAISASGLVLAFAGETGLWWRDFRDEDLAEWHRVGYPRGFDVSGFFGTFLVFGGDDTMFLKTLHSTWVVDLISGESELLPLDMLSFAPATTPEGAVVAATFDDESGARTIQEYDGVALRRTGNSGKLRSLTKLSAGADSIAAVREVGGPPQSDGVVALDRGTLVARAYLPFRDRDGFYIDGGGLATLAWLDDDTVLLDVDTIGDQGEGVRYLVTWNVVTGDLARVGELDPDHRVAFSAAP